METKLVKIKITDWSGTYPAELHIPEECDNTFKTDIVHFLSGIDDHDAMTECRKIWKLSDEDWENIC